MNIKEFLYFLTFKLKKNNILNPRFESEVLLAFALNYKREELYLDFDKNLSFEEEKKINSLLQRRLSDEPLAYIIEKKFFYKYPFFVNSDVLIPREETEVLLKAAIKWSQSHFSSSLEKLKISFFRKNGFLERDKFKRRCIRVLDMGTGSGCLGLSFLKEFENAFLVALDISKKALDVTYLNAKSLGVLDRLHLSHQKVESLTSKSLPVFLNGKFDVIFANPPYIDEEKKRSEMDVEKSVTDFEPHEALFSPFKGLQYLLSWAKVASHFLDKPSIYVCEVGTENQIETLKKELMKERSFHRIFVERDLSGSQRMLGCVKI